MKKFIISTLLVSCGFISLSAQPSWPLPESEGGWKTEKDQDQIESTGIDPGKLDAFGRWNIESNWGGQSMMPKSCIVVKDGKIIGEWYGDKNGNTMDVEVGRKIKARLSTNAKTFAMALFGTLVKNSSSLGLPEGLSLQSKLYTEQWLPEGFPLTDSRKSAITFDHVFRHASGILPEIAGNDRGGERSSVAFTMGKYEGSVLSKRLYYSPGHPGEYLPQSSYSSVAFNHLSLVFRNISGKPAHQLLEENLLQPIGITDVEYSTETEPRDQPWLSDGIKWIASGSLWLTPRDYARFGHFMLNQGSWNGQKILPENWVNQFASTGDYPNLIGNVNGYWTNKDIQGAGVRKYLSDYPQEIFSYGGSGMNWTYIIPSKNLVVVRTSRIFSVDEAAVEREFLTRLYDAFINENQKKPDLLFGQLMNDPVNRSHLVRNSDENKDGIFDPVFFCGPGNPGGFLYRGILNKDGTRNGDQIELLRKLKEFGGNSITVSAVRTHGGSAEKDRIKYPEIFPDNAQNPWNKQDPKKSLNDQLLDQWDEWFKIMDTHGLSVHFQFYDDGLKANKLFYSDQSNIKWINEDEKEFIRELVQRFKHHPNIIWCVSGNNYKEFANRETAITQIIETIKAADDHQHIISLEEKESTFQKLSDHKLIDQVALSADPNETSNPESLHQWLNQLNDKSLNRYNIYLKKDPVYQKLIGENDRKGIRIRNWAAAMTGSNIMIDGLRIEDISPEILKDCKNLSSFFKGTYINHMSRRDELSFGGTKYMLAAQGRCYIAYTDHQQGTMGIRSLPRGRYKVQWYDIEKGALSAGKIDVNNTDDYQWKIPSGFGQEVALYLVQEEFKPEFRTLGSEYSSSTEIEINNQTPSVQNHRFLTSTDTPVNIPLEYEDKDGGPGPYIITILEFPEKGTLSKEGDEIIYIPNEKEKGEDQIKWQVSDGVNDSEVAVVDIIIAKN